MKSKAFYIFIFLFLTSYFILPTPTHAQSAWSGRCVAQGDVATIQGLECLLGNILQVIVGLAGISFFVMFIYGGFQYLFTSNDPKKVAVASSTLSMAILGLVGVIASFLILQFIEKVTGAKITDFKIPG